MKIKLFHVGGDEILLRRGRKGHTHTITILVTYFACLGDKNKFESLSTSHSITVGDPLGGQQVTTLVFSFGTNN